MFGLRVLDTVRTLHGFLSVTGELDPLIEHLRRFRVRSRRETRSKLSDAFEERHALGCFHNARPQRHRSSNMTAVESALHPRGSLGQPAAAPPGTSARWFERRRLTMKHADYVARVAGCRCRVASLTMRRARCLRLRSTVPAAHRKGRQCTPAAPCRRCVRRLSAARKKAATARPDRALVMHSDAASKRATAGGGSQH